MEFIDQLKYIFLLFNFVQRIDASISTRFHWPLRNYASDSIKIFVFNLGLVFCLVIFFFNLVRLRLIFVDCLHKKVLLALSDTLKLHISYFTGIYKTLKPAFLCEQNKPIFLYHKHVLTPIWVILQHTNEIFFVFVTRILAIKY